MRSDGYFEPSGRTPVTVTLMPKSAVPVDEEEYGDAAWKLLKQTTIVVPTIPPPAATFPEFIDSLPPWEVDLLRYTAPFVDRRINGSAKFGI
jgi:hypothetical protein